MLFHAQKHDLGMGIGYREQWIIGDDITSLGDLVESRKKFSQQKIEKKACEENCPPQ